MRIFLKKFNIKSQIVKSIILIFSILILISLGPSGQAKEIEPGYEMVAENQYLMMYLNENTTSFFIKEKSTGRRWYSNPPDADRDRHKRQLNLTYYNPRDRERRRDNYNHSIREDQFEINFLDNGIRIDYTIGEEWDGSDYVPVFLSEEDFSVLKEENKDKKLDLFHDNYILIHLKEKENEKDREEIDPISGLDMDEVYGGLTISKGNKEPGPSERRDLKTLLADQIVENKKEVGNRGELTREDMVPFVGELFYLQDRPLPVWDEEDLSGLFRAMNYTPQEVSLVHSGFHVDPPFPNLEVFEIPVEYRLDDEDFTAEIKVDDIYYPENVINEEGERVSYPLTNIDFLEFFGAAGTDREGFIFVPDGSGSLIHLNNEKTEARRYNVSIYDRDFTKENLSDFREVYQNINREKNIHLPVYGLSKEDTGFLAVIENGESTGRIRADIARTAGGYNFVYGNFNVLPFAEVYLEEEDFDFEYYTGAEYRRSIQVYQENIMEENIKIRYRLMSGDISYVDLALSYREYLMDSLNLEKIDPETSPPFLLELVGALDINQPVMGVARRVMEPVTTYHQAEKLLEKFKEGGTERINLVYSGWKEGGLRHDYPQRTDNEPALTGGRSLEDLLTYARQHEIEIFPEVTLSKVYYNNLFDGFRPRRDAARELSRDIARYPLIEDENRAYILSPNKLEKTTAGFLENQGELKLEGISLNRLGNFLNSDFKEGQQVDRAEAKGIIKTELAKMKELEELNLVLRGGNQYVLPFADLLLEVPRSDSGYKITDRAVPFYQIALHGLIDLAGRPFNKKGDRKKAFLKTIETGTLPYYKGFYQQREVIKNTKHNHFYNAGYEVWFEEALDFYLQAEETLSKVRGQKITNHTRLKPEVYRTVFGNEIEVYVNYGEETVELEDGPVIPARDFILR